MLMNTFFPSVTRKANSLSECKIKDAVCIIAALILPGLLVVNALKEDPVFIIQYLPINTMYVHTVVNGYVL